MAFVHKDPDSCWSWGLGILGIGGSSVNYPARVLMLLSNVILTPQPPNGYGPGPAVRHRGHFQVVPTVAYKLNENWGIGLAPTMTVGKIYASPLFLGPGDDSNDERFHVVAGRGHAIYLGWRLPSRPVLHDRNGWHYGPSLKNPQWIEPFRYKSKTRWGARGHHLRPGLPADRSLGAAYSGLEKWVVAVDLRYFDYANTTGFRLGFRPEQRAEGPRGSISSVALGVQRRVSDRVYLRGGYCLNDNPIDAASASSTSPRR